MIGLLQLASPRRVLAHDLEVDQLSFFPAPSGRAIRGDLIFDPELTRELGEAIPAEAAKLRVLQFVRRELQIVVDGTSCSLDLKVRELYDNTGATSGDLVVWSCPLAGGRNDHTMYVQLGPAFKALMVRGPTLEPMKRSQHLVTDLVAAGHRSSEFRFSVALRPTDEGERARPAQSQKPWFEALKTHLTLGFLHIVPLGFDHVLFVTGLVLGFRSTRDVLLALTGFTLAHSLALALTALQLMVVRSSLVEPLIALSIAFLGVENLVQRPSWEKFRLGTVLVFGLVHGLGFARALNDLMPEQNSFLVALVGFNLGVEVGQLCVASLVFCLVRWGERQPLLKGRISPAGSIVLVVTGLWWAIARAL